MALTAKERSAARSARRRIGKGKGTPADVELLRQHKLKAKRQPKRLANELVGAETGQAPAPAPAAPKPDAAAPARPSTPAPAPMVSLAWPEPSAAAPASPGAPAAHPQCTIDNCPHCKNVRSARICGTTGKRVWPPMGKFVAKMWAKWILNGLSWALRVLRADKHLVKPTAEERDELAEGIREVQHRRISFLGAIDDLVQVGGALSEYTIRAALTPPPKPPPDARPPEEVTSA